MLGKSLSTNDCSRRSESGARREVRVLEKHKACPEISHIKLCATYIHEVSQWF